MMDNDTDENQLVHTLAVSLAENLLYAYPEDNNVSKVQQVGCWTNELLTTTQQRRRHNNDTTCTSSCSDNELVQRAVTMGMERYKSKTSTLPDTVAKEKGSGGKSFSFFDQLAAASGGGLASIITLDRLEQQATLQLKLELLLQVQHIDDIIHPDWIKVNEYLQIGLSDHLLKTRFQKLHQTLFEQSRSAEYITAAAQLDLCRNIVRQLETTCLVLVANAHDSNNDANDANNNNSMVIRELVTSFLQMWLDWMVQRGGGPDANVGRVESSIGKSVWKLLYYCHDENDNVTTRTTQSHQLLLLLQLQFAMQEQDPYARWFTSWVAHLSATAVVSLVESAPGCINTLVTSCERSSIAQEQSGHRSRHSLAILASILRQTRLSMFPWQAFAGSGTTSESIETIFDLYCAAIIRESSSERGHSVGVPDTELVNICVDTLDTILMGCSKMDVRLFSKLLVKVEALAAANSNKALVDNVRRQLEALLERLQPS